jgi:hypothetical protein
LPGHKTRAAGLFQVQVEADSNGMARLRWTKSEPWRDWARLSDGCCLLRSHVTDWTPEQLWRAYMQLTEAENAFHIQKSDLADPPGMASESRTRAGPHPGLFPGLCALENLGSTMLPAGLRDEPRQVFRELSEIALVDIAVPTRDGLTLRKRCIGQPNQHQLVFLQHLGLRLPSVPEFATV